MKDVFSFGVCEKCGHYTQLKNKKCINCNAGDDIDFLKDFFGMNDERKRQ